jgi:hypothetical protein
MQGDGLQIRRQAVLGRSVEHSHGQAIAALGYPREAVSIYSFALVVGDPALITRSCALVCSFTAAFP